jgi:DNA-binding transcriptional regulator YdaS (Cro superfamily)
MKLKKWLRKMKMPVDVFAGKCGVGPIAVSKWLSGGKVTKSKARMIESVTKGKVRADSLPKVTRTWKGRRPREPNAKLRAV